VQAATLFVAENVPLAHDWHVWSPVALPGCATKVPGTQVVQGAQAVALVAPE
jgi:hypothetical protein